MQRLGRNHKVLKALEGGAYEKYTAIGCVCKIPAVIIVARIGMMVGSRWGVAMPGSQETKQCSTFFRNLR